MLKRIKYIDGRLERHAKWLASSGGTRTSWASLRYGTQVQSDYDAPLVRGEEWETDALVKLLPAWARLAYDQVYLHRSGRSLVEVSRGIGLCGCAKRVLEEDPAGPFGPSGPWREWPKAQHADDIRQRIKRRRQAVVMMGFGRLEHFCTDDGAATALRHQLARADRLLSALLDQRRRGETPSLEGLQARRPGKAVVMKQLRATQGKGRQRPIAVASAMADEAPPAKKRLAA